MRPRRPGALGLPVVNDGEMRRESFQSEFTTAYDGFTGVDVNAWLCERHSAEVGDVTIARPPDLAVTAPGASAATWRRRIRVFPRGCPAADEGHLVKPDAVRQFVIAATGRRRLPQPGCVHCDVDRGAV